MIYCVLKLTLLRVTSCHSLRCFSYFPRLGCHYPVGEARVGVRMKNSVEAWNEANWFSDYILMRYLCCHCRKRFFCASFCVLRLMDAWRNLLLRLVLMWDTAVSNLCKWVRNVNASERIRNHKGLRRSTAALQFKNSILQLFYGERMFRLGNWILQWNSNA